MKKICIIFLFSSFCFYCLDSYSQNRNNIWCFGDSALIDFNAPNNPVTGWSSVRSRGSCVSIADTAGQLLFYAYTRYGMAGNTTLAMNKNNQVMQNGGNIVGEGWYLELIIVPYPNHPDLYYLFSISVTGSSQLGLYYSIIDMSLNAGLGAVTQKNTQLLPYRAKDGIKAIKHANGNDWWLIFRQWDAVPSNEFHVFLIDSNGVHPPIVQNVGSLTDGYLDDLVFTQDGSRFYMCNMEGIIERYDFDRCTGIISSSFNIEPSSNNGYWGISLSKNDSILYVSEYYSGNNHGYLFQYNLTAPNISATKTTIFDFDYSIYPTTSVGLLRLAPDDKIYLSCPDWGNSPLYYDSITYTPYNMNLGVINSPNLFGAACNFQPFSFSLGGKRTYWALPNNPNYDLGPLVNSPCYFSMNFSATDSLCIGSCTDFTNYSLNATSYQWIFPGAIPGTSTDINPQGICFPNSGSYDVTLIASDAAGSDTLTLTNYITVFPNPIQSIQQSGDTLISNTGFASYQWYLDGNTIIGATDYFYVAQTSGDYNVVCTDSNGCEVEAAVFNVIAGLTLTVSKGEGINLYPNPVTNKLIIQALPQSRPPATIGPAVEISIYNMLGFLAIQLQTSIPIAIGIKPETSVDVHKLPPGIYILEVRINNKKYHAKFVKE